MIIRVNEQLGSRERERERGGGKERGGGTAKENINITGANWHCSFSSYLPAYPERAVYNISRFHHTRMHVGSTIERRRICFKRALLWIINSLQASVSRCLSLRRQHLWYRNIRNVSHVIFVKRNIY